MRYEITSGRVAGHKQGDTVNGDGLGANVDALVAAGHLTPVKAKPRATRKADDNG